MTSAQKGIKFFAIGLAVFIIFVMVSTVLGFLNMMTIFTDYDKSGGDVLVETIENDKIITSLDIDLDKTNLEIKVSDEFKVEKINCDNRSFVQVKGNTLKITDDGHNFWHSGSGRTIIVYLPKESILNEVDIDVGAGKINLEGIRSKKLELEQGAGAVFIKSSNFDNAKIEGGAGRLEIKDTTMKDMKLEMGLGSVYIQGRILGNSEIESGMGALEMKLAGSQDDYTIYNIDGLGSFKVNGQEQSGTIGSGPNRLAFDGIFGSVKIDFE